jgi:hypothetical protein
MRRSLLRRGIVAALDREEAMEGPVMEAGITMMMILVMRMRMGMGGGKGGGRRRARRRRDELKFENDKLRK